jgi:hypothetical protein
MFWKCVSAFKSPNCRRGQASAISDRLTAAFDVAEPHVVSDRSFGGGSWRGERLCGMRRLECGPVGAARMLPRLSAIGCTGSAARSPEMILQILSLDGRESVRLDRTLPRRFDAW